MATIDTSTTSILVRVGARNAILQATQAGWHRIQVDLSSWSQSDREVLASLVTDDQGARLTPEIESPDEAGLRSLLASVRERQARQAAELEADAARRRERERSIQEALKTQERLEQEVARRLERLRAMSPEEKAAAADFRTGDPMWEIGPVADYLHAQDVDLLQQAKLQGWTSKGVRVFSDSVWANADQLGTTVAEMRELRCQALLAAEREPVLRLAIALGDTLVADGLRAGVLRLDSAQARLRSVAFARAGLPETHHNLASDAQLTVDEFGDLRSLDGQVRELLRKGGVDIVEVSWVRLAKHWVRDPDHPKADVDGDVQTIDQQPEHGVLVEFVVAGETWTFTWPCSVALPRAGS